MPSSRLLMANQRYAERLGWSPSELGATGFVPELIERIRAVQRELEVEVDGVLGPLSYAAILARDANDLAARLAVTPTDLVTGGRLAVLEAKRLWLRGVIDPPSGDAAYAASRAVIDALIRSPDGLDWDWLDPYEHDGDLEWCGSLAAWGWRAAGVRRALRRTYFASTFRLDRYASYRVVNAHTTNARPADAPRRWRALDEHARPDDAWFDDDDPPRAGDILLVGPTSSDYGKHICLVERFDEATGVFTTIEGNGTGALPDGRRGHGIVRARRAVGLGVDEPRTRYHARRLLRPSVHDLGA